MERDTENFTLSWSDVMPFSGLHLKGGTHAGYGD